jgi:hypothetical protein
MPPVRPIGSAGWNWKEVRRMRTKITGIIKTVGFIGIEQHLSTDTSIGGTIPMEFERQGAAWQI